MKKTQTITTAALIFALQGCSFTNRPYEITQNNQNSISTSTTLKINQEKITSIGELAFESYYSEQERNTVYCPGNIEYQDGIAKYTIKSGKYKSLGNIEVQPGIRLPFIFGAYQPGAIGGAPGYRLYFPINKDGTLYHSYYTDAFNELGSGQKKGELKEWGGKARANKSCSPPAPISAPKFNHCRVYYSGPTRANGYTAPRLTIDDLYGQRLETTRPGAIQTFCGVTIKVHETSDTFYFTVVGVKNNQ